MGHTCALPWFTVVWGGLLPCPRLPPGGATTNGPDATTPPSYLSKLGGGGELGGGVQLGVGGGCSCRGSGGGGVFLPGVGGGGLWPGGQGGVQPGVRGGGV